MKSTQFSGVSHTGLVYLYQEPHGTPPDNGWPLVVFLHGSGERGTNVEAVAAYGLPAYVASGQTYPFALVSPQCQPDTRWDTHLSAIAQLIDELCKAHLLDQDRVYASGLSMGGQGVWLLAAQYPEFIAAAIPICGRSCPDEAIRLQHLPVWAFHGLEDDQVPVAETQAMVAALLAVGAAPRVTLYPGVGHFDVWDKAYTEPELWAWLLAQKRSTEDSRALVCSAL